MLVLGLGLKAKKLGLNLGLASSGLGLDVTGLVNNHCHVYHVIINCVNVTITITIATTTRFPPPAKKSRVSLFEHYSTSQAPAADARQLERQLAHYMDYINASSFNCLENSMSDICQKSDFATLLPLFERVLCAPASSAPVERIFSQSGLTFRPHREKMSDQLLEALMFLKCNSKLCD